jgi:hypothetical protein
VRVYNVPIDFAQLRLEQSQLAMALTNAGTGWDLTPIQLQQAIESGKLLLRQHPCFQRLLLDLNALGAGIDHQIVVKSCPLEVDKTG